MGSPFLQLSADTCAAAVGKSSSSAAGTGMLELGRHRGGSSLEAAVGLQPPADRARDARTVACPAGTEAEQAECLQCLAGTAVGPVGGWPSHSDVEHLLSAVVAAGGLLRHGAGPAHSMDYNPTRWPESPRIVMRCAPRELKWPESPRTVMRCAPRASKWPESPRTVMRCAPRASKCPLTTSDCARPFREAGAPAGAACPAGGWQVGPGRPTPAPAGLRLRGGRGLPGAAAGRPVAA